MVAAVILCMPLSNIVMARIARDASAIMVEQTELVRMRSHNLNPVIVYLTLCIGLR